MDESSLPEPLRQALAAKTLGATGVTRLAIDGLLEFADDHSTMEKTLDHLISRLTGYAPLWHVRNAVREAHPASALRLIRTELDAAVDKSVATAGEWVRRHGGNATLAPSSSVVARVLAEFGQSAAGEATLGQRAASEATLGQSAAGEAAVGLAGADAIGPYAVLNIVGTHELAKRLPVLVVTTSLKLVPEEIFARLGAPVFERIPLDAFAGVVLDGEIVEPQEAGRRAALLRP